MFFVKPRRIVLDVVKLHSLDILHRRALRLKSHKAGLSLGLSVVASPRWRTQNPGRAAREVPGSVKVSDPQGNSSGAVFVPCKQYHSPPDNSMTNNKKHKVPDRWLDYQALGKRIPGTRFVAFKVPLKQVFKRQLSRSQYFSPLDLVQQLQEQDQELGLIIDLTFTTRYYKPEDLPESLNYLKIFTAGHEVPNDSTILSFKKAVRQFLRENGGNDKLIGVHCTHGVNRTGYLVCRYLIDVDGMDPKVAVELFSRARGHPIERQNYIHDLCFGPKRRNTGMEVSEQEPVRGGAGYVQDVPSHDRATPFSGAGTFQGSSHHNPYLLPQRRQGMERNRQYPPALLPPPPRPHGMWPPGPSDFEQNWRRPPQPHPPPYPVFPRYPGPGCSTYNRPPPPPFNDYYTAPPQDLQENPQRSRRMSGRKSHKGSKTRK
ncbi:RNA/RNP complex-1-interacting phosphatase [Amia ocellicauda]|uniref:RNA/RNP complex-1-interacting phosphatase n=1 Tax=Amia ocellicauda TaxID=2972642 RepID=UPI00346394AF